MTPQSTPPRRGRVYVRDGDFLMRAQVFNRNTRQDEERVEQLTTEYNQQAQFLPRQDWPRNPDVGAELRPEGTYPFPAEWWHYHHDAIDPLREDIYNSVIEHYGDLDPMPTFVEADGWDPANDDHVYTTTRDGVDGVVWTHHVAVVHGILNDAIPTQRMLTEIEMSSLIAIMTYGMGDAVTWLPGAWVLNGAHPANDNPYIQQPLNNIGPDNDADQPPHHNDVDPMSQHVFRSAFDPEFGMEIKCGGLHTPNFNEGGIPDMDREAMNWTWYRERIKGHRWVIVPIRQTWSGWTMTIFDRFHRQLYIFDPCLAAREERTEAIVHLWTQWWNGVGVLGHFTYFVPEVSVPSAGYDSTGLLSIHWLLMTLRNQVGPLMEQNDWSIETRDILIQPWPERHYDADNLIFRQRMMMHTSSIPLPNWKPHFIETLAKGEEEVERVMKIIICNELGLYNHPVMTERPYARRNQVHSADQRLRPEEMDGVQYVDPRETATFAGNAFHFHADFVNEGDQDMPLFFTAYGGPQFAVPRHINIRELDAGAHLARAHPVVFDGGVKWIVLPNEEVPVPLGNEDFTWPVMALLPQLYDERNPLRREMTQSEYRTRNIEQRHPARTRYDTTVNIDGRFFRDLEKLRAQGEFANEQQAQNALWYPRARIEGFAHGLGLQQDHIGDVGYMVRFGTRQIVNPAIDREPQNREVGVDLFFPIFDIELRDFYREHFQTSSESTRQTETEAEDEEDDGAVPTTGNRAVDAMNRQMRRRQEAERGRGGRGRAAGGVLHGRVERGRLARAR